MRKFLAAGMMLAVVVPVAGAMPVSRSKATTSCHKTFTVKMIKRAVLATYRGTKVVTEHERSTLHRFVRCIRFPHSRAYVRKFWRAQKNAWWHRCHPPLNGPAIASWYYDGGTTGCGFHATYGIATFVVPCGGTVLLVHGGRRVIAVRDDSGPYVAGRTFDLNPTTKAALGCSDLCDVMWH